MAFASVGSLGTVQSKTANQSSLVLTTSATLEANNLGVIIIAVDNNQTTDGDEGAVSGVVDSAGNTWEKGAEYTNGEGGAQAGATCSIWFKRVSSQLTSGGTITVSFTNNTSRDAAAATAWEYTVGSAVAVEATNALAADSSTTLGGSLDATTANIECLRIRGVGYAGNTTNLVIVAPTTNWDGFTEVGTSGSSSSSNMTAWGEFNISTGTGDASAPDSTGSAANDSASVYVALKETTTNKTLTADAGSYALTGTAATPKHGWKPSAGAGSYALTGTDATFRKTWKVIPDSGSYSLTGTAASPLLTWRIAADAGSFALTGTDATPKKGQKLTADAGSFELTGTDATFRKTWVAAADAGSYALTGTAASTLHAWKVTVDSGSYALTGTDATLRRNLPLIADAGSYTLTGTDASPLHGWRVTADAGSYALTGTDVTLTLAAGKTLTADPGSYALTGTDASLFHAWRLAAEAGSFSLTGTDVNLTLGAAPPEAAVSDTDGKRRGGTKKRRRHSADEELTEAEAQYVLRKIAELKKAKTAREEAAAAKALEIALAQAAQDDDAAEIISEAIEYRRPGRDYAAALRDVQLMQQLGNELMALARELSVERERQDDEDDAEALLLLT